MSEENNSELDVIEDVGVFERSIDENVNANDEEFDINAFLEQYMQDFDAESHGRQSSHEDIVSNDSYGCAKLIIKLKHVVCPAAFLNHYDCLVKVNGSEHSLLRNVNNSTTTNSGISFDKAHNIIVIDLLSCHGDTSIHFIIRKKQSIWRQCLPGVSMDRIEYGRCWKISHIPSHTDTGVPTSVDRAAEEVYWGSVCKIQYRDTNLPAVDLELLIRVLPLKPFLAFKSTIPSIIPTSAYALHQSCAYDCMDDTNTTVLISLLYSFAQLQVLKTVLKVPSKTSYSAYSRTQSCLDMWKDRSVVYDQYTPLELCMMRPHSISGGRADTAAAVRILLERCGHWCFQQTEAKHRSVLHIAVQHANYAGVAYVLTFLRKYAASVKGWTVSNPADRLSWLDEYGYTALMLACSYDVSQVYPEQPLLQERVKQCLVRIARLLVAYGAKVEVVHVPTKRTCLMMAVQSDNIYMVKWLLSLKYSHTEYRTLYGVRYSKYDSMSMLSRIPGYDGMRRCWSRMMMRMTISASDPATGAVPAATATAGESPATVDAVHGARVLKQYNNQVDPLKRYKCLVYAQDGQYHDMFTYAILHKHLSMVQYLYQHVYASTKRGYILSGVFHRRDQAGNTVFHLLVQSLDIPLCNYMISQYAQYYTHQLSTITTSSGSTSTSPRPTTAAAASSSSSGPGVSNYMGMRNYAGMTPLDWIESQYRAQEVIVGVEGAQVDTKEGVVLLELKQYYERILLELQIQHALYISTMCVDLSTASCVHDTTATVGTNTMTTAVCVGMPVNKVSMPIFQYIQHTSQQVVHHSKLWAKHLLQPYPITHHVPPPGAGVNIHGGSKSGMYIKDKDGCITMELSGLADPIEQAGLTATGTATATGGGIMSMESTLTREECKQTEEEIMSPRSLYALQVGTQEGYLADEWDYVSALVSKPNTAESYYIQSRLGHYYEYIPSE